MEIRTTPGIENTSEKKKPTVIANDGSSLFRHMERIRHFVSYSFRLRINTAMLNLTKLDSTDN